MPAPEGIHFVIFDLGGVIVRVSPGWKDTCARAGVRWSPELEGSDFASRFRPVVDRYQRGRITTPAFLECFVEATGGHLFTFEEAARIHDAWLLDEVPGAAAIVRDLGSAGIRTACLSNTNERHWDLMSGDEARRGDETRREGGTEPAMRREKGMESGDGVPTAIRQDRGEPQYPAFLSLDLRFGSHQLDCVKPESEIFVKCARQAGARPEEILFFDDLAENVAAARALGWRAETIASHGDPAGQIRRILARLGL